MTKKRFDIKNIRKNTQQKFKSDRIELPNKK
ncbi:hypothetical protein JOD18_002658 [Gracilibacillus alcaliphilus]|nr:hypothetical protein [Gracilibacillus alcaliphilus]